MRRRVPAIADVVNPPDWTRDRLRICLETHDLYGVARRTGF
jgi:hypothetical protein